MTVEVLKLCPARPARAWRANVPSMTNPITHPKYSYVMACMTRTCSLTKATIRYITWTLCI